MKMGMRAFLGTSVRNYHSSSSSSPSSLSPPPSSTPPPSYSSSPSSSSSIGTTAHCGLRPVEQCPSYFSYLSPTPSIFSLPPLEDLFLLPLSIFSWVFPLFHAARVIFVYLAFFCPSSFNLSSIFLCSTFVAISFFHWVGLLAPRQTPNLEDQVIPFCLGHHLRPVWHGRPYQHSSQDRVTAQAPPLRQSSTLRRVKS